MNQIVNLRTGCPLDFSGDTDAAANYQLECRSIRAALPAGAFVVAPRLSVTSPRGRRYPAGAPIGEQDLDGAKLSDEVPIPAREVLADLIMQGYVLASERQSDADMAAIAQHVAMVRRVNSATTSESVAGKLDELLATGRFVRVEPSAAV